MISAAENMFGKIRGRFDEGAAREQDRTLVDATMAAICAMPDAEFQRFLITFRRVFWRGPDLESPTERDVRPTEVTS